MLKRRLGCKEVRPPCNLVHQLAAVDLDDLTYQVVGGRRGEERDDPGRLLGDTLPSHRDSALQVLAYLWGREAVVKREKGYNAHHANELNLRKIYYA